MDNLTVQTDCNLLAFRPGETLYFRNGPLTPDPQVGVRVYRVALIPTPPIAYFTHNEHRNQCVICAEKYPTFSSGSEPLWGWVDLEPSTKTIIGNHLAELGARDNELFWMQVFAPGVFGDGRN